MRIIAGEWGGRRIQAPRGREVRPTTDRVREAWISALQLRVPGARVLDLFAGSGALGLECLSRGATQVVFVERARESLDALRRNIEALGAGDRCTVVQADAVRWIEALSAHAFDLALADPPYGDGYVPRLLEAFQRIPFARELWIEHRTTEPIPADPGIRQRRYGDTTLTTVEAP
jgi:16S rRNA (guanine966-N2)-methyltransferase